MNNLLSKIIKLDKTIHEPARIAILTLLSVIEKSDFLFLKTNTGLTQGNLSSHLSKLETAGYVEIEKTFKGKRPLTLVQLSKSGKIEFNKYLKTLKNFIDESDIL
jgi:DNA-binding transcriptional ArsR family regulator